VALENYGVTKEERAKRTKESRERAVVMLNKITLEPIREFESIVSA